MSPSQSQRLRQLEAALEAGPMSHHLVDKDVSEGRKYVSEELVLSALDHK